MKQLSHLLQGVSLYNSIGELDRWVQSLSTDTRSLRNQDCFVAIKGHNQDSHFFLNDLSERFSDLVVVCQELPTSLNSSFTYVCVDDTRVALAIMAKNFYDAPGERLKIVGVTGTNGKTTVATLLYQLFTLAGYAVGLISTVCIRIGKEEWPSTLTTPDALQLNSIFRQMLDSGCQYCFMEVSSHAADQKRVYGIPFAGGIFTNITHDHLDYHKTFRNYLLAKQSFFDSLPSHAFALTNKDDKNGEWMLQNTQARRRTYSLQQPADYNAKILELHLGATQINFQGVELWIQLSGIFNTYNTLAVMAAALELGMEPASLLLFVSQLTPVRGRFEVLPLPNQIYAIIDYAHTPDALENVLQSIQELTHNNQRVITVIGCGGNRDRTKRPQMAKIAVQYSDFAIFTSDNPRDEDPMAIIEDMRAGLSFSDRQRAQVWENRKEAIQEACRLAKAGDIILIAGKGHETYQEKNGMRLDFNDKQEVLRAFGLNNIN
jgi:UDP-N-acetylmuramoyl-L-alanyl-D-glutamate--2,6-diaminopimelate ligase